MQKKFFKANFLYLVGNKASSCIPAWFGLHADLQTQQVCPPKNGVLSHAALITTSTCVELGREVSKKEKSIPRRKVSWSPYCEISMRLLDRRFQTNFIRGPLHKIFYFHFHNMRSAFIIPLSKSEFLIFLGLNHISLLFIAPSIMPGTQQMFKHYF